jgi:hypothetical protein
MSVDMQNECGYAGAHPPQSTSVSSPSFMPLWHGCEVGKAVGVTVVGKGVGGVAHTPCTHSSQRSQSRLILQLYPMSHGL